MAKSEKRARDRKNPRSAELYAAARKAKNAERPKQRWIENVVNEGTGSTVRVIDGGHWER